MKKCAVIVTIIVLSVIVFYYFFLRQPVAYIAVGMYEEGYEEEKGWFKETKVGIIEFDGEELSLKQEIILPDLEHTPTSLEFSKRDNLLFVAGDGEGIEVIDVERFEREELLPFPGSILNLKIDPNDRYLYFSNPEFPPPLTMKYNIDREEVVEDLAFAIWPHYVFSKNGTHFFWRSPVSKNTETNQIYRGGWAMRYSVEEDTFVYNLREIDNQKVIEKGGLRFGDQWDDLPYFRTDRMNPRILREYDRDTLEPLDEINLMEIINHPKGIQLPGTFRERYPQTFLTDGKHIVVVSYWAYEEPAKSVPSVLVIDIENKEIVDWLEFSDSVRTNVSLTKQPQVIKETTRFCLPW